MRVKIRGDRTLEGRREELHTSGCRTKPASSLAAWRPRPLAPPPTDAFRTNRCPPSRTQRATSLERESNRHRRYITQQPQFPSGCKSYNKRGIRAKANVVSRRDLAVGFSIKYERLPAYERQTVPRTSLRVPSELGAGYL